MTMQTSLRLSEKAFPIAVKLFCRSRNNLVLRRPNTITSFQEKEEVVAQFLTSWNQGDFHSLVALMAEDITFWSDSGGQVIAAQRSLHGCQKVARFLVAIRRTRLIPTLSSQIIQING